jgi:hypothetical protein
MTEATQVTTSDDVALCLEEMSLASEEGTSEARTTEERAEEEGDPEEHVVVNRKADKLEREEEPSTSSKNDGPFLMLNTLFVEKEEAQPKSSPPVVKRRSILKPIDHEIPLKTSGGWKNLPAPTVTKVPRSQSVPVTAQEKQAVRPRDGAVRFASVHVRSYEQTVGDNPSVSFGTPIALDWVYEEHASLSLDQYEEARGPRRKPRQMMLNYYNRRSLLQHRFGFSVEEIDSAERAVNKVKRERAVTRALLPCSKVEDFFSSAARKTRRLTSGRRGECRRGSTGDATTAAAPKKRELPAPAAAPRSVSA